MDTLVSGPLLPTCFQYTRARLIRAYSLINSDNIYINSPSLVGYTLSWRRMRSFSSIVAASGSISSSLRSASLHT